MEPDSDRSRLTAIALRVLEDTAARADSGPIPGDWGVALALAWLLEAGALDRWHCEAWWREMRAVHAEQATTSYSRYVRMSQLTGILDRCYRVLGWPAPSHVQRREWQKRHRPGAAAHSAETRQGVSLIDTPLEG